MRKSPKIIAQSVVRSLGIKAVDKLNVLIAELDRFHSELSRAAFYKTLKSPLVKVAEKEAMLEKILPHFNLCPESLALIRVLAHRNQMNDLPKVAEALKDIRLREYRLQEAEVVTAKPLGSEQKTRAQKAVSRLSGSDILLSEKMNPAILGGLIFRFGDTVVDASLVRKIKELRKQLAT